MIEEEYFYKFPAAINSDTLAAISDHVHSINDEDWRSDLKPWSTFQQKKLPENIVDSDALFVKLKEQDWKFKIFKNYPNSTYIWHVDRTNRPAAINFVFDDYDAITLFQGNMLYTNQYEILKVPYEKGVPILLNTSRQHCVINFSEERYVVTISPPISKYVGEFNYETGKVNDSVKFDSDSIYKQILADLKGIIQ